MDDLPEWFQGTNATAGEEAITPQRFRPALKQAKQKRTRAAQILGISRGYFYRMLKKFAECGGED